MCLLAVRSAALLPPRRITPGVHVGDDGDRTGSKDEVDAVGEATKQRPPHLAVHERVALGHAHDLGEDDVEGTQKLTAETRRALLAPQRGIDDVCLGGRVDDEAHGSAGPVEPLLDAGAHNLPGLAGAGLTGKPREAAIEFCGLRLGERQPAGLGGDAVPEVFGELDALSDGEPADVEIGAAHDVSLPRTRGPCNTREVDTGLPPPAPLTSGR